MKTDLPSGTVTFLSTDIEGSTRLLQRLGERYALLYAAERKLLRAAFQKFHGREVSTQGDSFFVVFARAADAISASVMAQRALAEHDWGEGERVRVRMGLHTGTPQLTSSGYVGLDLHIAARICAAAHGGQVVLSQQTHDLAEQLPLDDVIMRDLGEHRLKDLQHPHRIFQLVISGLASEFPPLRTLDALPHNLPIQLTSFVGREKEIREIRELLGQTRLLTLTGAGGAGKTRLSLQVAAELVESYDDGVWLVELDSLPEPGLVPQAIAAVMGVREHSSQPLLNSIIENLRSKNMLLLLDNSEHVIAECARVADTLLRACPDLRILVTSREALGIAGETAWTVPSLSLPDTQQPQLTPSDLSQFEAVQLFVARAVAVQPDFKLTEVNAAAVAQICRRLDGIPLAIELAAARVKVLKTTEIAARLADRFSLLTGGSRTALPRHQTLRGAIDWSYELLSEPERVLLRRLSIFAGGWTLAAVEALTTDEAGEIRDEGVDFILHLKRGEPSFILDLLSNLVDKSLVVVDKQGDETRYRMLETIREYAREKLVGSGEAQEIAARHLGLVLQLAEQAEPQLFGPEQGWWFQRLELEHDNLRAALSWSEQAPGDRERGLRLAGALSRFWFSRGYLHEGRRWLETALEQNKHAQPAMRAKALNGLGLLVFAQGNYQAAQVVLAEGVELYKQVGDKWGTAFALTNLGLQFYSQGEFIKAASLLEESLTVAREIGDKRLIALALNGLGEVARYQGDMDRARAHYQESLELAREGGDKERYLEPLFNLGSVAHQQGDVEVALALFKEGLLESHRVGVKRLLAAFLSGLAGAWGARGETQRAGRVFGAAERLREEMRYQLEGVDLAVYDADVANTRAALGDDAFQQAWAEGRALTLEHAIEYALEPPTPRAQAAPPQMTRQQAKQEFGGLTERERETAARIAQGESNREIAEAFVVSERTVETHVTNILNKLGFTSRAEIRKWAVEKGLGKRDQ